MRYLARELESQVEKALRAFPALVLTGPRRAGKTCLLRHVRPDASYVLLEEPDQIARFRADPRGFLDELNPPVILDEIQHVPEVMPYVRARIDRHPRRMGQWLLTGSQEAPLMRGVTESMAGRAALLELLPLSVFESPRVGLLHGGYPEVVDRPASAQLWFRSYVGTYLERDVRSVTAIRDLATFRRFLGLVASRHGQTLNKTDLAAPLGVSVPTVGQWLSVLETTAQILVVPPYFENFGKRLTKSPKIYVADSGLACHLFGIESLAELARSAFRGALFEGLVASEIVKAQINAGRRRELFYFRDALGLEVDFIVPRKGGLTLVECKAGRTAMPEMASSLQRLAAAIAKVHGGLEVDAVLAHDPSEGGAPEALVPGVRALGWRDLLSRLRARQSSL